jgi:hypothetical protein
LTRGAFAGFSGILDDDLDPPILLAAACRCVAGVPRPPSLEIVPNQLASIQGSRHRQALMNTGSLDHPQQQNHERENQQQMDEATKSESRQERNRPEANEYDCNSFEHQESSMSGPKAGCGTG